MLRGNGLEKWDTDGDFSTYVDDEIQKTRAEELARAFVANKNAQADAESLELKLSPGRPLLQFSNGVAHVDLWFWTPGRCPENIQEENCMFCEDYTNTVTHRTISDNFPLQDGYSFLGRKTLVPRRSATVMEAEFGSSFLTPMVTHFECTSNYIQGKREKTEYLFDCAAAVFMFPIFFYFLGRLLPALKTPSRFRV